MGELYWLLYKKFEEWDSGWVGDLVKEFIEESKFCVFFWCVLLLIFFDYGEMCGSDLDLLLVFFNY